LISNFATNSSCFGIIINSGDLTITGSNNIYMEIMVLGVDEYILIFQHPVRFLSGEIKGEKILSVGTPR